MTEFENDDDVQRAVCVVVRSRDGEMMLAVSRGVGSDLWGLPGGSCKRGENAADAADRELLEETGLTLISKRIIMSCDFDGRNVTAFEAIQIEGEHSGSQEGDVSFKERRALLEGPFGLYNKLLFEKLDTQEE